MSDFFCYAEVEREPRYRPLVTREGPSAAAQQLRDDEVVGIGETLELLVWLSGVTDDTPANVIARRLEIYRDIERIATKLPCPRVFVSHRQADAAEALRIAELATNAGFYFWLDILDPTLASLGVGAFNSKKQAVAAAIVIELALLNCSHVVAVLTKNTPGSAWIPYEYGRVKLRQVQSIQASAWLSPTWSPPSMPEYLLLGLQHRSESDIHKWFAYALSRWSSGIRCTGKRWCHGRTTPLPS